MSSTPSRSFRGLCGDANNVLYQFIIVQQPRASIDRFVIFNSGGNVVFNSGDALCNVPFMRPKTQDTNSYQKITVDRCA